MGIYIGRGGRIVKGGVCKLKNLPPPPRKEGDKGKEKKGGGKEDSGKGRGVEVNRQRN